MQSGHRSAPLRAKQGGFSLVELSIVLVILGLLVGGILTAQNLIRAAELRSVVTDFQRYQAALYTFRDKYFGLPGDITNATDFWGADSSGCPSGGGATGTCNGNGDGLIGYATAEAYRPWQQMALAGLIEGTYSGVGGGGTGCSGWCDDAIGVNVPASKINNAGFTFMTVGIDPASDNNNFFDSTTGGKFNILVFGADYTNFMSFNPIIKPEEAWGVDKKIDDGKPQSGGIYTRKNTLCTTTTTTATAEYDLDGTSNTCILISDFLK